MTRHVSSSQRERRPHVGGITLPPAPHQEVRVRLVGLTVQHALYVAVFLLALLLRVLWLGTRPLSPEEAHVAWLSWQHTQPGASAPPVHASPLVYAVLWFMFLLTGGGDALARAWSALSGSVMVLLPFFLRRELGPRRALLAAVLIAVSPQLVYWSRHASGTIFVGLAALALVVALWRWAEAEHVEDNRWLYAAALAAGLLLTASPLAYTAVLAVGLSLLPWRGILLTRWRATPVQSRRTALAVFVVTLVVVGTVFLTQLPALANVPDLLGRWVRRFWTPAGYPWYWVPWRLAADEPLLVAFAFGGAWLGWRRRDPVARTWLIWAATALAMGLVQPGRTSQDVALLVVPLVFLAAEGLEAALDRVRRPSPTWREELVLAAAYFVILGFWFMMAAGYLAVGDVRYIPALAAVPVLLAALTLFYHFWLSPEAARRVLLVSLLITLTFWSWMALWVQNLHLAEDAALDALPGVEREVTHPNIRLLVQTLERISAQKITDPYEVPVQVLSRPEEDPVLLWYLRRFRNVEQVRSLKALNAAVVITPDTVKALPGYRGMDWVIGQTLLPTDLGGFVYHWWFYRESLVSGEQKRVVLWVRVAQSQTP